MNGRKTGVNGAFMALDGMVAGYESLWLRRSKLTVRIWIRYGDTSQ